MLPVKIYGVFTITLTSWYSPPLAVPIEPTICVSAKKPLVAGGTGIPILPGTAISIWVGDSTGAPSPSQGKVSQYFHPVVSPVSKSPFFNNSEAVKDFNINRLKIRINIIYFMFKRLQTNKKQLNFDILAIEQLCVNFFPPNRSIATCPIASSFRCALSIIIRLLSDFSTTLQILYGTENGLTFGYSKFSLCSSLPNIQSIFHFVRFI